MDSDVDVSGWVIELLLRDREKECIAKRVLAVAPFSDQNYRLKKTVLLRTIECEVCEASVSETILETLEMIEDLDISQGNATTNAMKAAYLAVATECTVKFLVGFMGKPSGKYLDAVDRIWRGRVGALERSETSQLVTVELRQIMDEVEAGVWDLKVSKKLSRMNTRNDALRLVSVYVKEALALLGPPFITWAIRLNVSKEVADLEGDQIAVVNGANVGGGSEVAEQTANGANASDGSELEAQMANGGLEVEAQTEIGPNSGERSELEVQMVNGVKVVGGSMDAEMAHEDNLGGPELEVQMANGRNVGDEAGLDEEIVDGTNVAYGFELEERTSNGTNAGDEPELEAQMVSRDNVVDESKTEAQNANGSILGDEPSVEASEIVDGTDEHDGPQCPAQTTGETALEAQPVRGADIGNGLERQIVNGVNVRYESALSPQPSGMQLQKVGAGCSQPTVSRGLGSNDVVETDSGFTNREVYSLAGDQVCGEVNERGVALPSTNGEQGIIFDTTTNDREIRSTGVRQKHLAHRRTRGPVKIRDAEDLDSDSSNRKSDSLSTPELTIAQEALKSSMLELQSVVTDPLPDALRVSETIRSDLVIKSVNPVNRKDVAAENPSFRKDARPVQSNNETLGTLSSSHQNNVPEASRTEKNAPNRPPADQQNGTEAVQTNCANVGNPYQTNARPSLMERSTTARTYEWDDSIDMSQEDRVNRTSRLHLPSPKRHAVSPLKKLENKRFTKRRRVKRWSLAEEDALRDGVKKHGKGNWKSILNAYSEMFVERTEVDLKDKWRNMTRYPCE